MSDATEAYPLSDAEARERAGLLRRLGLAPIGDEGEARSLPAARAEPPGDAVGVTPYIGADGCEYRDPYIALTMETFDQLIGLLETTRERFNAKLAEIKLELAQLRAALAETRSKADATDFVVQRLQIDRQGPPGPPGPMGRDGRDGNPGPRGEKGSRGQRGFEITGWKVDVAAYHATPVFYDNSEGPPLNLLPFFERYNADTEADEVEAAIEDVALKRAALELEVERTKRGLPAR
jgi:hypothetical protein